MNTALWVVQWILTLVYAATGLGMIVKSLQTPDKEHPLPFTNAQLRGIGVYKVICLAGLLLPVFTSISPRVTAIAAGGLAAAMVGASAFHIRRREWKVVPVPVVLCGLALFLAYGRSGAME